MRQPQPRPCRTSGGQPFLYLRNPLFVAPLLGHRPAAHASRHGQPSGKPVLDTEGDHTLCGLLSCACLPPRLTQNGDKKLGKSEAKGMRYSLSKRERLIAPFESLVRVAEKPQSGGCQ